MECLLPRSAFSSNNRDVDNHHDSTKCVDGCSLGSTVSSVCDVSTPVCNSDVVTKSPENGGLTVDNDKGVSDNLHICSHMNLKTDLVVGDLTHCKSPIVSSTNRLPGEVHSFALDDSMSHVSFLDGDLSVCLDDKYQSPNVGSKSPVTCTPIKSTRSSQPTANILNSIHTKLDEPHLNISDDDTKNPILANSVRRTVGMSGNTSDISRSLQVLGTSRCWTDRYDNDLYDDVSATQSPIRSLTSLVNSSQPDLSDVSVRPMSVIDDLSPVCTPVRSFSRSVTRLPDIRTRPGSIKSFDSTNVADMSTIQFNPMCNLVLTKDEMCKVRLSSDLEMLYKHFKNMCTIIRRSCMRNEQPYFRVVQMMVQRMSRRSFTLDNLRQMVWLAPNLVSIKWVLITDTCRKKYSAEYKDSNDKVYDLLIKLLRPDFGPCSTTHDYENVCFRFKTILCSWSLKCAASKFENFQVPMAQIPENKPRSNYSTPRRDSTPMRLDDTPVRSLVRNEMFDCLNSTPRKSFKIMSSQTSLGSSKRLRTIDTVSPMSVDLLDTPGMRRIKENARKIANDKRDTTDRVNDLKFWIDMRWFTKMLLEIMALDTAPIMKLDFLVDFIVKYGSRKVTQEQVTQWINALTEIDPSILDKSVSKFEDYTTVVTLNRSASLNNAVDFIDQKIKTLKSF